MSEHAIQLRRAWDLQTASATRRVDLPTIWDAPGPRHLARSFRRPPIDPSAERLSLRLRDVAGLRAVRLNGREIPIDPGSLQHDLELPAELPDRNRLELDVELAGSHDLDASWGSIALVIQPV